MKVEDREMELIKEVGALTAKMDMLIQSVNRVEANLSANYTTKTEFEDLKKRVEKQENVFHRWFPHFVAGTALLLQFMSMKG